MKSSMILYLLVSAQVVLAAPGQIDELTVEQLAAMADRTLVVELPTMEEWYADLPPTALQDTLRARYLTAHRSYLENIEEAVRTNWKFNTKVEFKTRAECFELMDKKSTDHVLLMKGELWGAGAIAFSESSFSTEVLVLQRAEASNGRNKKGEMEIYLADRYMLLAGEYHREDKRGYRTSTTYHKADLAFTLRQFQRCIAWSLAEKTLGGYREYVREQVERNCGRMKDFGLVAQQDNFMGNATLESCMASYTGKLRFASHEEIGALYTAGDAAEAVVFILPFGSLEDGRMSFIKVVVDPSTDDLLEGHRIAKVAGSQGPGFAELDFKSMSTCEE